MGVDKTLQIEYDLSSINEDQANKLIKANEKVLKKAQQQTKKQKKVNRETTPGINHAEELRIEKRMEKLKKQVEFDLISGKGKDTLKSKLFGNQDFSKGGITKNLVKFGLNPGGVIGGLLKTGIPGFGIAVAATGIIVKILQKFDDLEKRFTDDIRTRLNQERDNQQTAQIQAGLSQEFFTPGPGITDPRDAYNTFDEFNTNQKRIEEDYAIRTTSGVE